MKPLTPAQQRVKEQTTKLNDISTRLKSYEVGDNVRVSLASDIDDVIDNLRSIYTLSPEYK